MKDRTTYELVHRLNQIRVEVQKLWIESNRIIEELHERLPHLKKDPDLQIKKLRRRRYERKDNKDN